MQLTILKEWTCNPDYNKDGSIVTLEDSAWDIESIITDEFPWEQLPQAIEQTAQVDEAPNVVIR